MADNKITSNEKNLSFELVSDNLRFVSKSSPYLSFELTNNDLKFINNSNHLSFELNTYNEAMAIFQIVLQFMFETGGVY